jgi:hypothetical protein
LVPAGFIAGRITHNDDETCISLPEPTLQQRVRHVDEYHGRFKVAIVAGSGPSLLW